MIWSCKHRLRPNKARTSLLSERLRRLTRILALAAPLAAGAAHAGDACAVGAYTAIQPPSTALNPLGTHAAVVTRPELIGHVFRLQEISSGFAKRPGAGLTVGAGMNA